MKFSEMLSESIAVAVEAGDVRLVQERINILARALARNTAGMVVRKGRTSVHPAVSNTGYYKATATTCNCQYWEGAKATADAGHDLFVGYVFCKHMLTHILDVGRTLEPSDLLAILQAQSEDRQSKARTAFAAEKSMLEARVEAKARGEKKAAYLRFVEERTVRAIKVIGRKNTVIHGDEYNNNLSSVWIFQFDPDAPLKDAYDKALKRFGKALAGIKPVLVTKSFYEDAPPL